MNSFPTPCTSSSFRFKLFVFPKTSSKFYTSASTLSSPSHRAVNPRLTDEISWINLSFSLSKNDSAATSSNAAMEGRDSDIELRIGLDDGHDASEVEQDAFEVVDVQVQ